MTLDLTRQLGPVVVTVLALLVYYGCMILQTRTKFGLARTYAARGEKFDRYFEQDREMLAADRVLLNMQEHLTPFLVLLWLHAVFVGPTGATVAGGAWVGSRLAYPFLLGGRLGRDIPPRILVATGAGYLVLVYLFGAVGYAVVRQLTA